jgi:hypothetical protein
MDKKIAGLLGAAAALTTMSAAQANAAPSPQPASVSSYRDLLEPIANPRAALIADDARLAARAEEERVQLAQYYHHHHHHNYYHHHHHHHHHGYVPRVYLVPPYRHHHHHHHHHHHGFYIPLPGRW